MKLAWPRPLRSGSTDATTTWISAIPPLVIQVLVPLRTHSSFDWSYTARVRMELDVGAGIGLGHAESGQGDLVGRPEALRHPFRHLFGSAVAEDPGYAQRGTEDGQADAGIAPRHLLHDHRYRDAGGVGEHVGHEVEGVQPDVGGLLDDRPRGLLPLVPLVGDRAHDLLGEVVNPLLELKLVLVQGIGKIGHRTGTLHPGLVTEQ